MGHNNNKEQGKATLDSVMKEMSKPRLATSVREAIGKTATTRGKFPVGALLHNRNTKEDGLVRSVYQLGGGDSADIMYEVAVPIRPNTWRDGHYVSDWVQGALGLSDNATLRFSDKPTT